MKLNLLSVFKKISFAIQIFIGTQINTHSEYNNSCLSYLWILYYTLYQLCKGFARAFLSGTRNNLLTGATQVPRRILHDFSEYCWEYNRAENIVRLVEQPQALRWCSNTQNILATPTSYMHVFENTKQLWRAPERWKNNMV